MTLLVLHDHPRIDWLDYNAAARKSLRSMTNEECELNLRFRTVEVVLELRQLLRIPDKVIFGKGKIAQGDDALMIFLAYLAEPFSYDNLALAYGRRPSAISELVNHLLGHMYDRFYTQLLQNIGRWEDHFPKWASAVASVTTIQGMDIVAFMDGTCVVICRPSYGQDPMFNGKDRTHCIKVICVVAPNGLVVYTAGPFAGSMHDARVYDKSGLEGLLNAITGRLCANGHPQYCIGGDKAFALSPVVTSLFKPATTAAERAYNKAFSKPRTSVEWGFGICGNLWTRLKSVKKVKLFVTPPFKMYVAALILTNAYACEYGNQVSLFFGMADDAPSMEEYLGDLNQQVPL